MLDAGLSCDVTELFDSISQDANYKYPLFLCGPFKEGDSSHKGALPFDWLYPSHLCRSSAA